MMGKNLRVSITQYFHWVASNALSGIIALHEYRGADKSLARPTSLYILFDGENISFDSSLVTHTHIYY
jgi:hypothetical protein